MIAAADLAQPALAVAAATLMALSPQLADALRAWHERNSEGASVASSKAAPTSPGSLAASIRAYTGHTNDGSKSVATAAETSLAANLSFWSSIAGREAGCAVPTQRRSDSPSLDSLDSLDCTYMRSPDSVVANLAGGGQSSTPARIKAFAARHSFAARRDPVPLWTSRASDDSPSPVRTPAVVKQTSGPRGSPSPLPAVERPPAGDALKATPPRPAGDADASEGRGLATLLSRLEGEGVEMTEEVRALARSSLADSGGHVSAVTSTRAAVAYTIMTYSESTVGTATQDRRATASLSQRLI